MKIIQIGQVVKSFITIGSVLFLGGCYSVSIGTNPDAYPFPSEQVFNVQQGVEANITNFYTESEIVKVGVVVYADLQHFTDTALKMVQRELELKGVDVSPNSSKSVILKMINPSMESNFMSLDGKVTLQASLGNGKIVSIDAENRTGGNAMRAFNGAILKAVTGLLQDDAFEDFLNEP